MILDQITTVSGEFDKDLSSVKALKELEDLRIKYLSRNGIVSGLFEKLKDVPKEEKPSIGNKLNELRTYITDNFNQAKIKFDEKGSIDKQKIDLTLPGFQRQIGSKHILTQTVDEIKSIFKGMG
jgi:phenylalanyl-tRNA synthetase alpha chain